MHTEDKQNGFTLIEVLFVLGVWAIIILLSAPLNFSILEKQKEQQFFNTFHQDVLYLQNLSYSSNEKLQLRFYPEDNSYRIFSPGRTLVERKIPEDWRINNVSFPQIIFTKTGTIRDPGTFFIYTNSGSYEIIFPFGKGRCYLVKQ